MEFGKIGNIPEVLCYYRQHLKSTVSSRHWQAPVYAQFARKLALERREKGTDAVQRGEKVSLEFGPPLSHRENHVHLHTKWAWWALMNGHVKTARRHALLTATHAPLSLHTWRLVYCAVRGH
jgi:hypothetical protein